jgi:cytidylate kinase
MIDLVTIDREYRSGGSEIARALGERLGWRVWDEQLTLEIARRMECGCSAVEILQEQRDPLYYRLLKAFFRGSAEGVQNVGRLKMVDADCIREIAAEVVTAAATAGHSVIVGRGSAYALHDRPHVFHVFVYAPLDEKLRRMEHAGVTRRRAITLLESVDRDRAAFIKQYFGRDWPDRHLFHLMINSAIGNAAVVDTILEGIRQAGQATEAPSHDHETAHET